MCKGIAYGSWGKNKNRFLLVESEVGAELMYF